LYVKYTCITKPMKIMWNFKLGHIYGKHGYVEAFCLEDTHLSVRLQCIHKFLVVKTPTAVSVKHVEHCVQLCPVCGEFCRKKQICNLFTVYMQVN